MSPTIKGKISILIPCFNESLWIVANLREVDAFFKNFAESHELICIDDGSQDQTLNRLQAAARDRPRIRVLHYPQNQGKGYALRSGFQVANGDYIVFLDADLDLHPRLLGKFFEILQEQKADVVIGSKRYPESRITYPLRRKVISSVYHWILLILFGLPLRDTQVGLKLFKREVLENVFHKIICKRFALDVELLANVYHLGYKIAEAPIELEFRREVRWGRVRFSTLWCTLIDTLAIYYRMYFLKYYDITFLKADSYPKVSVVVQYEKYSPEVEETLQGCLGIDHGDLQILAAGTTPPKLDSELIEYVALPRPYQECLLHIIEASQGEVIAFVKPGAVPDRHWLGKALKNLGSEDIVAVAGPILPQTGGGFWCEAAQRVLSSLMGWGGFRYRYVQSLHRFISTVTLTNLIVKKENLFLALERNPMDGNVEAWLGPYIARKTQRRIVYDPEVIVYDSVTPLFRPHLAMILEWGLARGHSIRLNPSSVIAWPGVVFTLPSLMVLFVVVGGIFSFLSPLWLKSFSLVMAGYFGLVAAESFSSIRPRMVLSIFFGIVSTHFVYGIGCLVGLLSKNRGFRSRSAALDVKNY